MAARTEEIGRFCRWGVLAWVAALAGGCALLARSAAGQTDPGVALVVADMICQIPGAGDAYDLRLTGYFHPPLVRNLPSILVAGPAAGRRQFVSGLRSVFWARLPGLAVGDNPVVVRGTPYGVLGGTYETVVVRAVLPQADVWLVDGRLALAAEHAGQLPACLDALDRRGHVVLFHPGPLGDLSRDRPRIRNALPARLLICTVELPPRGQDDVIVLLGAASRLRRGGPDRPNCRVVTADGKLARSAAGHGFATDLIGPPAAGTDPPKLRRHPTLANFESDVAAEPIRENGKGPPVGQEARR